MARRQRFSIRAGHSRCSHSVLGVSRFALDHPLVALAFEHVRHGQSGPRRSVSFGLEMDGGFRLLAVELNLGDRNVHRREIAPLSKIFHHRISHGILALDVFLASA